VNGFLSGSVLDSLNRRVPNARIEVIDLDDAKDKAPLSRTSRANAQGYFQLAGLNPGHRYLLTARAIDGNRQLTGRTKVIPPNPRVAIPLLEEGAAPAGEADPPSGAVGTAQGGQATPTRPAAPAVKPAPSAVPAPVDTPASVPGSIPPAGVAAPVVPNPERTALGNPPEGGFNKAPTPIGSIPGPGREPTYPTPSRKPDATPRLELPPSPERIPSLSVPGPGEARGDAAFSRGPIADAGRLRNGEPLLRTDTPTTVPSCVREGQKVQNLALYDTEGAVWELRKNRKRLVLLDFWYSSCGPCMQAIPHLVTLQRKYGSFGLSVVGIAYEKGTMSEQVNKVRSVRGRLGINYTTLLGSGNHCPVRKQMEVNVFPTLVLIDETGTIVWNSKNDGLDAQRLYDLEMSIRKGLRLPLE
jgi:thiol-disulfide isomerase/thioredoxin